MRPGRLTADERAIEGLPIRLVIALVVGVACLGVMMNTLAGVQTLGVSELDVQPKPEVVGAGGGQVAVTVVGPEGEPIADATVVAKSGTARLNSVQTAKTGANGKASLSLSPTLGPNQEEGTVEFDVKPPAGGQFADKRGNTDPLVVAGNSTSSGGSP